MKKLVENAKTELMRFLLIIQTYIKVILINFLIEFLLLQNNALIFFHSLDVYAKVLESLNAAILAAAGAARAYANIA